MREFAKLGLTRSVGGVLALALSRELTPVVTCIILAGGAPDTSACVKLSWHLQQDSARLLAVSLYSVSGRRSLFQGFGAEGPSKPGQAKAVAPGCRAGRVGSAFAAELGTMAVSEQTDSLRVLGSDPVRAPPNACAVTSQLLGPSPL